MTDGRTARGEATRSALLAASMELIGSRGAAAATQRTVAAAAGASLASTTYHFGTRAELLSETLRHASGIAITEIELLRDEILAGTTDLVTACLAYIDRQRSGASLTAAVVFELAVQASREPDVRDASQAFVASIRSLFTPFVAPGIDLAVAQSFCGVLLFELSLGPDSRSSELETTVRAVFDAFGVTVEATR